MHNVVLLIGGEGYIVCSTSAARTDGPDDANLYYSSWALLNGVSWETHRWDGFAVARASSEAPMDWYGGYRVVGVVL